MNSKFLYATDCIEVLQKIENTLINIEQIFVLQPDVTTAIRFFEELRICLEQSIPNDKKRC